MIFNFKSSYFNKLKIILIKVIGFNYSFILSKNLSLIIVKDHPKLIKIFKNPI